MNDENILDFELTFEEAVKYFKGKLPITKKQFDLLNKDYKSLAFTVSNYTNVNVINEFYQEILKALEDGTTINEFKENMNTFLKDKGYDPINNFKADLIFRNNIQTAYQVGHYEQMTDEDVLNYRPYWQYDAVLDEDTRPEHRALDGLVFKADDPFWDTWYPPNGHRCRCTVKSLSERNLKTKGLSISNGDEISIVPDKDFNTNPAKNSFDFNVNDLPKSLKNAYSKNKPK